MFARVNFICGDCFLLVMKVLFVCNMNKHRSKTAEMLFRDRFQTKSAGLFNEKPVAVDEIEWADTIAVMEDFQREELVKRFPNECVQKRLITLGVPDFFQFNQPELIDLLKTKVERLI